MRLLTPSGLFPASVTLFFIFSMNMKGTWGCEPGKLCGTWIAMNCCVHPEDHADDHATGRAALDHEDHGCNFSPIPTTPRSVTAAPIPPLADAVNLVRSETEHPNLVAESADLIPDSRGPPLRLILHATLPGLRAPPSS